MSCAGSKATLMIRPCRSRCRSSRRFLLIFPRNGCMFPAFSPPLRPGSFSAGIHPLSFGPAFLLNGFVFIVIGLQLPGILRELHGESLMRLIDNALIICGVVVLVRIVWVVVVTYVPRLLSKKLRKRDPAP